ncbi:MAG: hypothetical protein NT079_04420, partial [Candidatus Omnitrophica bacterium]|nr:hypothetical protein [Candidatus Omnitrophota bacterium]
EKGRIFSIPQNILIETDTDSVSFYPDGTMDRVKIIFKNKNEREIMISTQERRGQIDVFSPVE